jgi:hypothetical protein
MLKSRPCLWMGFVSCREPQAPTAQRLPSFSPPQKPLLSPRLITAIKPKNLPTRLSGHNHKGSYTALAGLFRKLGGKHGLVVKVLRCGAVGGSNLYLLNT